MCSIGAKIPATVTTEAVVIALKLQFPKKALAEWGKDYLTSVHIKYKATDKIIASEPSQYKVDRYFEYLPKKVYQQTATIAQKFVTYNRGDHPRLTTGNVTMKWILLKCNIHLDTREDIEEHTAHTHGININKLKREASIKVNDSAVLQLAKCTTVSELPTEKRRRLVNSWFNSCASTGTIKDQWRQ